MSGEVEIIDGWDAANPFVVMDWSCHKDSGWIVGTFTERREAVKCARQFAAENDKEIWNAEVVELPRGRS